MPSTAGTAQPTGWPKAPAGPQTSADGGRLCCGTLLFAASAAQQIGITLNPSTAKAGFLTAMYVVLVPVFGLFLGRRGSAQLWLSMVIAVGGLYLLCMKNGFGGIETSDWILLFLRRAVQLSDHDGGPLCPAGGRCPPEPAAVLCGGRREHRCRPPVRESHPGRVRGQLAARWPTAA